MKKSVWAVLVALAAAPVGLLAQESAAGSSNPITNSEKGFYGLVSGEVIAAAEKMPEANYSFRPTPEVRSFGQIIGHIADAQYGFCSSAAGMPNPMKNIEKSMSSKTELVAALKNAVAYCYKAFDEMTDARGSQMMKLMNYDVARLTVLSVNTAHMDEHYGNLVTYLRIKGIVPPSSEPHKSNTEQQGQH